MLHVRREDHRYKLLLQLLQLPLMGLCGEFLRGVTTPLLVVGVGGTLQWHNRNCRSRGVLLYT